MQRAVVWAWPIVLGLLVTSQVVGWYVLGLTGSGYAGAPAMFLTTATAVIVVVLAYRAVKHRAWRVVLALGLLVIALAVGIWGAMGSGVDAYEAEQIARLDDYRTRVAELDHRIVSTDPVEVTASFPEFGYVAAERSQTGQLVVQFNSRWGRRGLVYVSRDDIADAAFPEWFGFKKLRPRWYFWLGSG